MKPNVTDPFLTHSPTALSRLDKEMAALCESILGISQLLVREGVAFHMTQAAKAVEIGEAELLLRSMLAELNDSDSVALSAALTSDNLEFHHRQVDSELPGWADKMGQDFALAAAAFWLNYKEGRQASDATSDSGGDVPEANKAFAEFKFLASRYYVTKPDVLWTVLHGNHGTPVTDNSRSAQRLIRKEAQTKVLEPHG